MRLKRLLKGNKISGGLGGCATFYQNGNMLQQVVWVCTTTFVFVFAHLTEMISGGLDWSAQQHLCLYLYLYLFISGGLGWCAQQERRLRPPPQQALQPSNARARLLPTCNATFYQKTIWNGRFLNWFNIVNLQRQ